MTDAEKLEVRNPATGDVVGVHAISTKEDVDAAVAWAREYAEWWAGIGFDQRKDVLDKWRGILARRMAQLADGGHQETGKPHADAMLECGLAIDHLAWAAANAKKVLGRHRVPSGLVMANQAATVEYLPRGVIGVIGPWNYPVFTPMGSIVYALAAGNAVVFKPSEYTPAVGVFLVDAFREAVPEQPVFQVITGFGDTGAALCRAGVDKLAFTGSAPTGRKIMAACAETLTPVVLELGGNDALLVDDDADVRAAARAAVWGGCANAGQTCIGVERVYVVDAVYDTFVDEVVKAAGPVHAGEGAALGPMTMPKQIDVVKAHVDDAIERGAKAVVGGPESVRAPYIDPIVLVDVPDDARVMREETFGPVLTITRVATLDEAIEKANRSSYGLGAAVFGKKRAYDAARRVRSGMASVNSVLSFAGFPSLPFGGVGGSGFGRIHGEDGLKEFTRPKAIARQRFSMGPDMMSFERPDWLPKLAAKLGDLRFGRAK